MAQRTPQSQTASARGSLKSHCGPALPPTRGPGRDSPRHAQAQALLTGADVTGVRMKPEPRPHRASDNGARGLNVLPHRCGPGTLPWPPSSRAGHGARRGSTGHSLSGCLVCSGRSSCSTDRTALSGSLGPRTGAAKDLKVPACRLGHTPAWTQRAEPWGGDTAWLGCRQGGQGRGLEGQELLPCLPGHVQSSDVHTRALRVVPGPSSGGAGPPAGGGSGAARTLGPPSLHRP